MMNPKLLFPALAALIFFPIAQSHSWLECTNYNMIFGERVTTFDHSKCSGYARCGSRQANAGFGIDTGFNHHLGNGVDTCQCRRTAADAYASAPMAKYRPGQRVCLAYPAKNHVAATCTNAYIPDNGVRIKRSAAPVSMSDSTESFAGREYGHLNGVHVSGTMDYKGFQNCPDFCSNMDKAVCTMCFDLEADIAPGVYSFQWLWEFNTGDFYSSCWEAEISGSASSSPNVIVTGSKPTLSTPPAASSAYPPASPNPPAYGNGAASAALPARAVPAYFTPVVPVQTTLKPVTTAPSTPCPTLPIATPAPTHLQC